MPIKSGHQSKTSPNNRMLGFRTKHLGKSVLAVRDETLRKMAGSHAVEKAATQKLQQQNILVGGHGQRRTTQLPIPIWDGKKTTKKPRFWLINPGRLQKYAKTLSRKK